MQTAQTSCSIAIKIFFGHINCTNEIPKIIEKMCVANLQFWQNVWCNGLLLPERSCCQVRASAAVNIMIENCKAISLSALIENVCDVGKSAGIASSVASCKSLIEIGGNFYKNKCYTELKNLNTDGGETF
jgi:hypothetical protein